MRSQYGTECFYARAIADRWNARNPRGTALVVELPDGRMVETTREFAADEQAGVASLFVASLQTWVPLRYIRRRTAAETTVELGRRGVEVY